MHAGPDERRIDALRERNLIPPARVDADDHVPQVQLTARHRDCFRGALVGTGIGDALGRPGEGMTPSEVRLRWGELRDFMPWRGYEHGPVGTITDDTQLTIVVAECLLANDARIDPDDIADRFVSWFPEGRGKGAATSEACRRLGAGEPWHEAATDSAGNGAAMRAAPLGLAHFHDFDRLRLDAALATIPTHAHPMAVASAAAQGYATALCVAREPGTLDPRAFLDAVVAAIDDIEPHGLRERHPESDGSGVKLAARIAEVGPMLDGDVYAGLDRLYSGAFVLESLPAALLCFLASPEDPETVIVRAATHTYDSDTVGAMAGALAGAYHGAAALPDRWTGDLEFRDDLVALADALFDLTRALGARAGRGGT